MTAPGPAERRGTRQSRGRRGDRGVEINTNILTEALIKQMLKSHIKKIPSGHFSAII